MALFYSDHAQLFIMSAIVVQLHKQGKPLDPASTVEYFPNCDKHGAASTLHRSSATNIYKTKDGRFFHIHGSYLACYGQAFLLNTDIIDRLYGLSSNPEVLESTGRHGCIDT